MCLWHNFTKKPNGLKMRNLFDTFTTQGSIQMAYDYLRNKDTIPDVAAYADMPDELEKIVDGVKYSMKVYRYENLSVNGGQSSVMGSFSINDALAEIEWMDYGWKVEFRAELIKF